MFEYDIKRFNRRCCKTDREFKPGDVYYSALVEDGDQWVRLDFGAPAWEGPPAGSIGWWRCRVALHNPNRAYWAPAQVLLDYFAKLAECPDKSELYYLMALVLLRKRLLHLIENKVSAAGTSTMVVHAVRTNRDFSVPVCESTGEQLLRLQDELCEHLFTDQPWDSIDMESAKSVEAT